MAITIPIVSSWDPKGVDAANRDVGKAESGWTKTGSAIKSAAAPAAAALVALGAAGFKAAQAAEEAAAVNAKLSQVFKSMGYEQNTQAAMDYADALSKQIGVDDEVIKTAQTKLATFSEVAKSTETMGKATSLAADLSAAGFGSMDSAAVMLGKAIQNPIKGLTAMTRVGVTFSEQQEEAITRMVENGNAAKAQGIIMDAVAKQVGGVAEESATNSAKMSVAFGEVTESIGAALLPAFEALMPMLQSFASWAQEHTGVILAFGIAITAIAGTILVLAAAIKTLEIIKAVIAAWKAWTASSWALNASFLANPIVLIIVAIVALIAIIVVAYKKSETFRRIVDAAFSAIKNVAKMVWNAIVATIKWAWDWITRLFRFTPFGMIITNLDKLKIAFKVVWAAIQAGIRVVWDWIKTLFRLSPFGMIISNLDKLKEVFSNVFDAIKDTISDAWDFIEDIIDKIQSGFDAVGGILSKVGDLNPFSAAAPPAATTSGASVVQVSRSLSPMPGIAARSAVDVGEGRYAVRRPQGAVTININGAIDADGTARAVRRILDGGNIRQGRARGAVAAVAW